MYISVMTKSIQRSDLGTPLLNGQVKTNRQQSWFSKISLKNILWNKHSVENYQKIFSNKTSYYRPHPPIQWNISHKNSQISNSFTANCQETTEQKFLQINYAGNSEASFFRNVWSTICVQQQITYWLSFGWHMQLCGVELCESRLFEAGHYLCGSQLCGAVH